jgi:fumarate reductase (CoM/CoB) subunit A
MVQFTGNQLWPPWLLGNPALLVSLCGGEYRNAPGKEFMKLPQPRDALQKLAYKEIKEGRGTERGGVYIDLTASPLSSREIEEQLKSSLAASMAKERWKLIKAMSAESPDPKTWKIEFTPGGAHFFMGGVRINPRCETNIDGLYAAGETAGGVQGANRMGGNALTEIIVFGARAGRFAAEFAARADWNEPDPYFLEAEKSDLLGFIKGEGTAPKRVMGKIAAMMAEFAGVARTEAGLNQALTRIQSIKSHDLPEMSAPPGRIFNLGWVEAIQVPCMLDVAEMIIRSALFRQESRGAHYREDYEDTKAGWLCHTQVTMQGKKPGLKSVPVIVTQLQPEERK